MGKMKKKGSSGAATAFISRNQALKKLQLTLKDFRRLCILKGIYPVEPTHKRKVNRGSSLDKTYYLLKDVQFLSHEPIIWKFWDFKIFMRRLSKAKGRRDFETVKRLRENRPFYKLNHIVKERYPTITDALRDMDDALSMCFLFGNFAKSKGIPLELIELSRRLAVEFMLYVIETRSLRKVFISIKGIYYQADIMGQTVTWIVPHQFVFDRIEDVDFNVMKTFAEFYITLVGFINYRLFTSINIYYPLKAKDKQNHVSNLSDNEDDYLENDFDEQIASLNTPLASLVNTELKLPNPDEFEDEEEQGKNELTFHGVIKLQKLFDGLKFFLNREVPRESLVFVIRSFGGVVSWDKNLFSGATFDEEDTRITHQICDREFIPNKKLSRYYIQPQWVYDSVNAKMLLPVEKYFLGETLPPHLSPFVEEKEGEYVPPEKQALLKLMSGDKEEIVNSDVESSLVKSDIQKNYSETKSLLVKPGTVEKSNPEKVAKSLAAEEKRLSIMMIPKKKKRLYNKIMYGKRRDVREAEKLKMKREEFESNRKQKNSNWKITDMN